MAASRAPGADCDEGRGVCALCPDRPLLVASGESASRCLSQAPQLGLQAAARRGAFAHEGAPGRAEPEVAVCPENWREAADCLLFAGLLDRGFKIGDASAARR
jgi:hypothetical protein